MISLIVPCYNEQESLPIFYDEVTKVVRNMGVEYELLLVNDGSKDKTLEIMRELSAKDEHVKYHSFSRNFGKEAAMYAGFCNAKGDYAGSTIIVTTDVKNSGIRRIRLSSYKAG